MDDTPVATPDRLRVKRDGPRGWHWIAASNYDPSVHELHVDEEMQARVDQHQATLVESQINKNKAVKNKGRTSKKATE